MLVLVFLNIIVWRACVEGKILGLYEFLEICYIVDIQSINMHAFQ